MIDPSEFLAEFQAAREKALANRMAGSPGRLREMLDRANLKEAREMVIRLWIALFTTAIVGAFLQ